MIWTRSSIGLPAKHPSPHPTCQFTSELSQNSSQGLWRKAQRGTRPGPCGSVSLWSEFTAAHTPSAPCSPTGFPHTEQLPIFLHLIALAFVHVSFTSQAQQAVLFSWASVHKSSFIETTKLDGSTQWSSHQAVKQNQAKWPLFQPQNQSQQK